MKKLIILYGILFFLSFSVQAQEIREIGRYTRSVGMGGMLVPLATPEDAVFFNPAVLGVTSGLHFELVDANFGLNGQEAIDLAKTGSAITSPSSYNQFFGKKIWLNGMGKAAFAAPYFGFGYLTGYDVNLELHNPGFPQFQTFFQNDTIIALGGAVSLGNKVYLGSTVKRVLRWGGNTVDLGLSTIANANSLSSIGDSFANRGTAYGVDLALMKEFDAPTSPRMSLVLQDVGYTTFKKTAGSDAPPRIDQNLSFGIGGGFDLPGLDWTYGFEMRHLLESSIQLGKKVHLGTELSIPFVDLRMGVNQGYMTYGVGFNFLFFRFDVASYQEELGTYPGQTSQSRLMAGLSLDLSLDANFNFSNENGKKRKLKQRR